MKQVKIVFYIFSFTWGIVMTLAGLLVAGVLLLAGKRPKKHGWCYYFEVGENWGGFNLGIIFLTSSNPPESTKNHEFGHAIQNIMWGPLMPFVITIPSAIRYWYRELRFYRRGKSPLTSYYDIWFERNANELGGRFMERISIND
jgi:hypothetical protein